MVFDGQNNQQKQNQDIEDMITQKYNGIVLIPITVEGAIPVIQYANRENVPVITVDREVVPDTGVKVVGFVGASHRPMGVQTANCLLPLLEETFTQSAATWNLHGCRVSMWYSTKPPHL